MIDSRKAAEAVGPLKEQRDSRRARFLASLGMTAGAAGIEDIGARIPWSLLAAAAVVALAAFAVWPLLGDGMIVTGDTLHAVRIFEMHRCLDDGQLPCRWAPDLGNGYGYPLFNYYPPLPYFAGDAFHRLGLSYLDAIDALYIVGLTGAGLSMYLLGRSLWGSLGGLVSAVAYLFAPYLALDVYMRGALAELWALAFAPALLWALYELLTTGRLRYVPVVALLTAALLLSHSLSAVILAPAAALWVAVLAIVRGRDGLAPLALALAAAAWGFGLAAFFALPALAEGSLVQLDSLTLGPFHYSNHFTSAGDLFFVRTADYTFLLGASDGTPVQIGWFHWGIVLAAVPAAVLLWRVCRPCAWLTITLAAFFTIGVFMATAASKPVWDAFDSLRFLQFPWRYMGLVSLASAALAGAWLRVLRDRSLTLQLVVAGALIALFIASGRMFFQPVFRLDISDEDVFSSQRFEDYQGGSIHDYLPKDVEAVPPVARAPARVASGTASITKSDIESNRLALEVAADTPGRIEASVFQFPDWRVRIDGEPVPHEVTSPSGLIAFDVPAGEHEVELQLEDTDVRSLANAISLASWLALAFVPAGVLVFDAWRRGFR